MKPIRSIIAYALALAIALPLPSYAQAPETTAVAQAAPAAKPTPAPRVVKPKADQISGPTIELPATVSGDVGAFVRVKATTTGKFVEWTARDNGLNVFPADMLRDSRETVVTATRPGSYRLIAWTALGDVPSKAAECVVVIGGEPVVVPPVAPPTPDVPPVVVPTDKPTAAVYVYEKDDGSIPPPVGAALDKINREKKVTATSFEDDSSDGDGDVPEQYKLPLAAAREIGLPAFIVMAGDKVINRVKSPTTLEQVLGAVP